MSYRNFGGKETKGEEKLDWCEEYSKCNFMDFDHFLNDFFAQFTLLRRDGNGEGRGEGTNLPVPIPDILRMSPSPSELFERISIPSPNNNRGSPRVPDPRITNTFFCFRF